MSALQTAIPVIWLVFWLYWLAAAVGAKQGSRSRRSRSAGLPLIVVGFAVSRVVRGSTLTVHTAGLEVAGLLIFLSGIGLAVWARLYLGRNWGMPMSNKEHPELVTSGPYHFIRHPIYSGILLGVLGTTLAISAVWLIPFVLMGAYFVYSARVEEGLMATAFPSTYPGYKASTKMLVPFVL